MRFPLVLLAATVATAAPALAHPMLVSTSPGANAVVSPTAQIRLVFSEPLIEKLCKVDVSMTAAGHGTMSMPGQVSFSSDRKTLIVTYAAPLHSGAYKVSYQVVSADTHKVTGSYAFRVR